MTTRSSIPVWWISRVSLSQRGTTTCRCLEKPSSEFWRLHWKIGDGFKLEDHMRFAVLDMDFNACVPVIPQDSPGSGLPCWHGWRESRGEPQEDQATKDVWQQGCLSVCTWCLPSVPCLSQCMSVSCSYVMTSGYKPAPLDLSHVKLTPNQNQLVEKLAENGHNVWARDRVRQGWTYSIVQVTAYIYHLPKGWGKTLSFISIFCDVCMILIDFHHPNYLYVTRQVIYSRVIQYNTTEDKYWLFGIPFQCFLCFFFTSKSFGRAPSSSKDVIPKDTLFRSFFPLQWLWYYVWFLSSGHLE